MRSLSNPRIYIPWHARPFTQALFNIRLRSLTRANTTVLLSLVAATALSGFPRLHTAPWLVVPAVTAVLGTADTVRCMQKRWSFYHGGVLLCLYMDCMVITLVYFFFLYPYFL